MPPVTIDMPYVIPKVTDCMARGHTWAQIQVHDAVRHSVHAS